MTVRLLLPLAALMALPACSPAETREQPATTRFPLDGDAERPAAEMPGKIDPANAGWAATSHGARYAEPGKAPLIELACRSGSVEVIRHVRSDREAKAMLAFVGYRGVLRLKVTNDGMAWHGSLPADDPHWIAVTGGPFYATVAGGGKVISPASSVAAGLIDACKANAKPDVETAPKAV